MTAIVHWASAGGSSIYDAWSHPEPCGHYIAIWGQLTEISRQRLRYE